MSAERPLIAEPEHSIGASRRLIETLVLADRATLVRTLVPELRHVAANVVQALAVPGAAPSESSRTRLEIATRLIERLAGGEPAAPLMELEEVLRELDECQRLQVLLPVPVTLRVHAPLPLRPVHAGSLLQALMALVTNAREAVLERGSGKARIDVTPEGAVVVIAVEDDGPGLAIDPAERAFLPFVSTKSERGNLGVGLTVARYLLRRIDGDVKAEVAETGGARFIVWLRV